MLKWEPNNILDLNKWYHLKGHVFLFQKSIIFIYLLELYWIRVSNPVNLPDFLESGSGYFFLDPKTGSFMKIFNEKYEKCAKIETQNINNHPLIKWCIIKKESLYVYTLNLLYYINVKEYKLNHFALPLVSLFYKIKKNWLKSPDSDPVLKIWIRYNTTLYPICININIFDATFQM